MPIKNSRKEYAPQTYYHAYTRGVNKQIIFRDEQDYAVFQGYLKRYLSPSGQKLPNGQVVRSFAGRLDLVCFCLMPNHIHLLFYQHDEERALPELLQRIFTTYSMYYNKKYDRVGPVFQSRYLASRIDNDPYLHHISRYIHRNPNMWSEYEFSSLRYYTGDSYADWINPQSIMELFDNDPRKYLDFLADMSEEDEEELATVLMAHE